MCGEGAQDFALFPRRHMVTKALVRKARQKGLVLATWTVNEESEMKKLLSFGVDAMATNFPGKLNLILNKKCA